MAGPRFVLFGKAGAGKTALLGALARCADDAQRGKLRDVHGSLGQLAQQTYANQLSSTAQETIAHAVDFEEFDHLPWSKGTLVDTQGKAAQAFLANERGFTPASELSAAALQADALIVVVDPNAEQTQLVKDFNEVEAFLDRYKAQRGVGLEPAGLPVYVVLSKCDLMARPGDTFARWLQRIEDAKRKVGARLRDLASTRGLAMFGDLAVNVWATAVRRPALADVPASAEPYGVAELFRQCVAAASSYQQQRDRAGYRLSTTLLGVLLAVAVFALGAGTLLTSEPSPDFAALEQAVAASVPKGPTAAERLRGSTAALTQRLDELNHLQDHALFAGLPAEAQHAVQKAARETDAYLRAQQEAQAKLKLPQLAKDEAELKTQEQAARDFELPAEFAADWAETRLGKRVQRVRGEYAAFRKAEQEELAWVQEQQQECQSLLKEGTRLYGELISQQSPPGVAAWLSKVSDQLSRRSQLPNEQPIPGVTGLRREKLYELKSLQDAQREWTRVRNELGNIRNYVETRWRR